MVVDGRDCFRAGPDSSYRFCPLSTHRHLERVFKLLMRKTAWNLFSWQLDRLFGFIIKGGCNTFILQEKNARLHPGKMKVLCYHLVEVGLRQSQTVQI